MQTSSATSGCRASSSSQAASYTRPSCIVEVSQTGVSSMPASRMVMNPVHSPIPLSTAPPATTGRVGVLGEHERGHAGARGLAGDRRVAEADTGDVEHRVGRAGRQHADHDSEVAGAGHADILPESGGVVILSHESVRRAGGVVARRPGSTTPGTRSGSASRPRAPRSPRASTRSSTRWAAQGHDLVEATPQPDDALHAVHDPELLEFLRTAADALGRRPVRRAGRPGPGGAVPVPDARDDRRPADPAGGRRARGRRAGSPTTR